MEFLLLLTLMLFGALLRHWQVLSPDSSKVMNQLIIYIALPALILTTLPHFSFRDLPMLPLAVPWTLLALMSLIILLLHHVFKFSRQTLALALLLGMFGNTSFVGIPMVGTLLGDDAVAYALLYDQLGSFLALSSIGLLLCAIFSGEKISAQAIGLRIVKFPPFWAMIIAISLPVPISGILDQFLQKLSALLLPLALLSVGVQFRLRLPRHDLGSVALVLSLKLLLAPGLALLFGLFFSDGGLVMKTVLLEAAMGPMISAGILAMEARLDASLVGAILAWGLALSFATVPLWLFVANTMF